MLALTALILAPQTFEAPVQITGQTVTPLRLIADDFDGDGVLDLVAVDEFVEGIDIAIGRGDGSFVKFSRALQLGAKAKDLLGADLDGDGVPELIIFDVFGEVSVAKRQPDGFYSSAVVAQLVFTGLQGNAGVDAADVDGDGDLDLLAGSDGDGAENLRTVLIENLGGLSFAAPVRATTQLTQGGIAAFGDLNGDMQPDVIAANGRDLVLCTGMGGFESVTATTLYSGGSPFTGIRAVDFDLDGDLDVLFKDRSGRTRLMRNLGFGVFAPAVVLSSVGNNDRPLRVADFDGDGAPGLLDLGAGTDRATVLINTAGSLRSGPTIDPLGPFTSFLDGALGDFDSDGVVDVAMAAAGGQVAIYLGQPVPYLVGPLPDSIVTDDRFADTTGPLSSEGFGIGDFDGDGDLDIAGIDGRSGTLRLFQNTGTTRPVPSQAESVVPPGTRSLVAGDFDGDGLDDVALISASTASQGSFSWLRSAGGGTFSPMGALGFRDMASTNLQVGDVNGDGADDIVSYSFSLTGRLIEVAFGGPSSSIENAPVPVFPLGMTGSRARFNLLGDVNGDGRADLLLPDPSDAQALLIRLGGPTGFDPAASLTVSTGPGMIPVAIGDVDGSGRAGIVLRFEGDSNAYCVDQIAPGVFGAVRVFVDIGTPLSGGTFADFDGGGILDVALMRLSAQGPIYCALNRGTPSDWELSEMEPTVDLFGSSRVVDIDADGDLDVIIVDEEIGIYRNRTLGSGASPFCAGAALNSSLRTGALQFADPMGASGAPNALLLSGLPPGSFALVVTGRNLVAPLAIPGSAGRLCLGSPFGRFAGPGQLLLSDAIGAASLLVDPTRLPLGTQPVAAFPGETWYFQAWYRDTDSAGAASSNLTSALAITWQ